ncbi:MAG: hypothetical protein H6Q68_2896 [Firmicutes bacterium]|nr:hypothetical protein [Bacillota bacterium]
MMTRAYYHNGYCGPIHRKRRDYHKTASIVSFMNVVVGIIFIIAFIVAFIGGLLLKSFIF